MHQVYENTLANLGASFNEYVAVLIQFEVVNVLPARHIRPVQAELFERCRISPLILVVLDNHHLYRRDRLQYAG